MSKQRQPVEQPRHLYLVLDDWSGGYSIRKIDVSPYDTPLIPVGTAWGDAVFTGIHGLPSATLRFEARRGEPKYFAGAFGSKILALRPVDSGKNLLTPGIRIYDVRTRCFTSRFVTWPDQVNPIYIPVGDGRLFALTAGSSELLNSPPSYDYDDTDGEDSVSAWAWSKLPAPTLHGEHVTSYATHPDGRTIFVSIGDDAAAPATFSLDTTEPKTKDDWKWELHGQWQLPFTGHAYFVPELDAWVGLSGDPGKFGRLCSCDVLPTSPDDDSYRQYPALKLSKENLFTKAPAEKHIGATLVYMGVGNKFCLLESICIETGSADRRPTEADDDSVDEVSETDSDDDTDEDYIDELMQSDSDEMDEESVDEVRQELDRKRFFRLTTFSVWYDRNGDLTTRDSRQLRYYSLPREVTQMMLENPVAFWM